MTLSRLLDAIHSKSSGRGLDRTRLIGSGRGVTFVTEVGNLFGLLWRRELEDAFVQISVRLASDTLTVTVVCKLIPSGLDGLTCLLLHRAVLIYPTPFRVCIPIT